MAQATRQRKQSTGKGTSGPFRDILDVARLLSSSAVPEQVIETVLTHLCERLGKRSRCALLEGEDLRLRFCAGKHSCPVGGVIVDKNSIVWEAVRKGVPINLTEPHQTNGYAHSLAEPIKIKSIIPLAYVDPLTQETKKIGALIVDSGQEGVPISGEDFEYLQVIGQLVSAVAGRAELIRQLMETAHNFRNSIAIIGGFSQRIAHLAADKEMAEKALHLHEEVKALEGHLAEFEAYMSLKT